MADPAAHAKPSDRQCQRCPDTSTVRDVLMQKRQRCPDTSQLAASNSGRRLPTFCPQPIAKSSDPSAFQSLKRPDNSGLSGGPRGLSRVVIEFKSHRLRRSRPETLWYALTYSVPAISCPGIARPYRWDFESTRVVTRWGRWLLLSTGRVIRRSGSSAVAR